MPNQITSSPDGALWVAEIGVGKIGRFAVLAITSLSPASAISGGPAFTLTVNGYGFTSDTVVEWNNAPLPTTYVSPTQLTAFQYPPA